MDFCSSYAGFLNASSKNQILFTAQMNGKNANPTEKCNERKKQSCLAIWSMELFSENIYSKSKLTSEIPFAQI